MHISGKRYNRKNVYLKQKKVVTLVCLIIFQRFPYKSFLISLVLFQYYFKSVKILSLINAQAKCFIAGRKFLHDDQLEGNK